MAKSRRPKRRKTPKRRTRPSSRSTPGKARPPRSPQPTLHAEIVALREQQAATAEILRVISSSPTEVQPVFDAIASSATRLCDASFCIVFRFDGEMITVAADDGRSPGTLDVIRAAYPSPPGRQSISARAIFERRVISIADAQNIAEYPQQAERARAIGYRAILAVPMMRGDAAIGTINVARLEAIPFTDTQVELLKTFADQAVIAIENVRLFTELQTSNRELTTALDQQTATGEILRVIASSPTDVQPVFEAIVASAARLCDATFSAVARFDGELLHLVAVNNMSPEETAAYQSLFPRPPGRHFIVGRAFVDGRPVHVEDVRTDPDYDPRTLDVLQRSAPYRTYLGIPIIRDGVPIGAIGCGRREVKPFTATQIELVKTFADQAVIAIENVRLFTELEARNNELKVALEQQTATSELLKVIGRSTFDLQPVFETLAENAVRLCEAERAFIWRPDGQVLRAVVIHNAPPALREFAQRNPIAPGRHSGAARAALERRTVHIRDALADAEYTFGAREVDPIRTVLAIPMLRADELLGVIAIYRLEVRPFTDSQIALMETFADQAAIAIENARLLSELQARTAELTHSVQELKALGEVSQALSSTLDLDTVLSTIVSRANQIAGTDACTVYEYDEEAEEFHMRATHNLDEAVVAVARRTPIRRGEGVAGRMAVTREPVQIPDIAEAGAYHGPLRDVLLQTGTRALLSIPLLREDHIIGGLTVNKKTPGEFSPEIIDLLKTFAGQSALAIQNARLFREIEAKSRELEVASQHKSEFLANMSHELRTPLNAVIGFSEVLLERMFGEVNDKQAEYLGDIHTSAQHLLSLINDILDLSKIEAGRMELDASEFDLPTAIDNALTLVRERASRRGIALEQTIDARLGPVRADERKVKQVLLNLLSNALKFTPEGGRVDVRAGIADGYAEISVTDTGVGIAPEDHDAVFEEFRQVGSAEKKSEGTGLGLPLAKKFIELHGGRIWLKSQIGAGSTFTFTLPLKETA